MAIIINTNFKVNAPDSIDDRLIVDRVSGTTASLVSLTTGYNYKNMYVWVREEKAFYYLIDSPPEGGATNSDWARLISGSGSVGGSGSAIDITEVAFGTGTGITSSRNFTFATSSTTLIFGSGSTIASSSRLSSIIGGCSNTIGTASCNSGIFGGFNNKIGTASVNSGIFGGCINTIGTSSLNSGIFEGSCNNIETSINSLIIGGFCNTLSSTSSLSSPSNQSSIVGGSKNTLCRSAASSIVGGGSSTLFDSCSSSIIGGQSNKLYGSPGSSILGGANNIATASIYSSIIVGCKNTLSYYSRFSSILGGCSNTLSGTSSFSSIIGGCGNTLCNNSCNSVIIGGVGLTLSNECNVVYVPKLKIETVSNVDASKILVLDTDNVVKYRDVSTIGGGGSGSISLKLNAGLTNSGTTYATIYNTTVPESTNVPGLIADATPPPTIGHPLTWLRGLTAGYFSQKNIVEVLDMILFPAIPFAYTTPTLTISNPFSAYVNGLVLVNSTPITAPFLLTYNTGNNILTGLPGGAAAIQYSWQCNVNGVSYNTIGVCATSSTSICQSVLRPAPSTSFPISTPTTYLVRGTVSHQSSLIGYDSAGNPTPIPSGNLAGSKCSTCVGFSSIFPYYFGTVSRLCASIDANDIMTKGTRCTLQTANNLTVNFNSTAEDKGFLATPKPLVGNQIGSQTVVTFVNWCESGTNYETIPGPLFTTISTVPGVTVNGISQTYSVYLFSQGSATTAAFKFTT